MPPRARAAKKDPFENDPFTPDSDSVPSGDEAQTDLPPWAGPDAEVQVDTKEIKVETSEQQGKMTVTLKGGTGYEQPWVVVHGKDSEDLLNTFDDPDFAKVLERTRKASQFFVGTSPATQAPVATQPQAQTPQQAPAGASGDGRTCRHGAMIHRSGFNAQRNSAWTGYFCPTPKGTPDQCKAQFIN